MYATLEQLRAEGISSMEATDERLRAALDQATALIDRACGWFFEPRDMTFVLSGTGSQILELPVPPIHIVSVAMGRETYPGNTFETVGAPVADSQFCIPKIIWSDGRFRAGHYNVRIAGRWGYTVPSAANKEGVPPLEIQRAAMLLAQRYLPPLGSDAATDARNSWRLIEERTREQSYRMEPRDDGPFSGDPEVDAILLRYRRPIAVGAA